MTQTPSPQSSSWKSSSLPSKRRQRHDEAKPSVLVRYGKFNRIGHFAHNEQRIPSIQTQVVVQTDRGLEIGKIISPFTAHDHKTCTISAESIDAYTDQSGPSYPLSRTGRLVRMATVQDLNEHRHIQGALDEEAAYCKRKIRELKLKAKLVDVEHLFGGERIIFYFKAEGRIDFRALVQELHQEYNTRIEMHQVGARDEAKLLGDCDTCGQELCCKRFLKVLQPVNIKMAKTQHLPLNQSKISGVCGRLKCCLRYENVAYEELQKRLPRVKQTVMTEKGAATVLDTMALTQLVKLRVNGTGEVMALNVEELLSDRVVKIESKPEPSSRRRPENSKDQSRRAPSTEGPPRA